MQEKKYKSRPFWVVLFVLFIVGSGYYLNGFTSLNRWFYDVFVRLDVLPVVDDVVIVAIDEDTVSQLGRWPWSRSYHAQLLPFLKQADAIFFDVIFAEASGFEKENSPDRVFAAAMQESNNIVLPVYIESLQYGGNKVEVLPLPIFSNAAAGLGHAHIEFDTDGISRSIFLKQGIGEPYWPHVSVVLAKQLDEMTGSLPGQQDQTSEDRSPYLVYKNYFNRIKFIGASGSVPKVSYIDVLNNRVPQSLWSGKRVFIGATAQGLGDYVSTPLGLMSGVEYHVNIYQGLRKGELIAEFDQSTHLLISLAYIFIITVVISRYSPAAFLTATLLISALTIGLSFLLMLQWNYWFSPVVSVLGLILFYPLWSWRRIELALSYLKDELAGLQASSARKAFHLEVLEEQLGYVKEMGFIASWRLHGVKDKTLPWPEFQVEGLLIATEFMFDGDWFRLELTGVESSDSLGYLSLSLKNRYYALLKVLVQDITAIEDSVGGQSHELVARTISEINLNKDVIEKLQSRMDNSLDNLQDAIVISDMAGRIIYTNATASRLFGLRKDSRQVVQLLQGERKNQWQAIVKALLVEDEVIYQELDLSADKRYLCQASLVDGEQQTFVFVFTDVTRLRQLERSKNEAMAFLSHDMRSPIVSMLSLIETYRHQDHLAADDVKAVEILLEKIENFARRNLKFSEDFLQLSLAENIDEEVLELVDIYGVIDTAYAETYSYAKSKQIEIILDRSAEDSWVKGDVQLLERALINLMSNAIKYTPQGKSVVVGLSVDDWVKVSITDQGIGISPSILPTIFEPYFRLKKNDMSGKQHKSFGLGLSFVDTVAKRHGGQVVVKSIEGKGSTFIVELPRQIID